MTYLTCPCGYRMEFTHVEAFGPKPQPTRMFAPCPACRSAVWFVLQPAGIDDDGPHGDRLVPVEGDVT